nr:recombinase family protein [Polycladomyces sp. WAk]
MLARIYVRVSTDEQAREGFSLAAQEERCRQFAQSQGWEVDEVYCDDGYSAKDLNRPAIQRAIRDVKAKKFDVLVVYRLDRLVRSVTDLHYLLNIFSEYGVKFKSVTEVFDTTTAMGRFFITLVGAMSQWERENLSERIKMGLERRFMEGNRHGHAPFGYDDVDGRLVVNRDEAAIVRWIFEQYKRHGMNKIAHKLNQQGIKTKTGVQWQDAQIYYILTNPVYIGQIRYHVKKGHPITMTSDHEPIISEEEFYQTQQLIKKRSRWDSAKALTSDYPFSGVLVCGKCGHFMYGGKQKNKTGFYYIYRCSGRFKKGICDAPIIPENKVVQALFEKLDWIAEDIEKPEEEQETRISPQIRIKQIEAELERIKKRRKKWQEAYANDVITLEELRERTQEDRKREEQLKAELESIPQTETQPKISHDEFLEALKNLRYVWKHATRREQKEMIHSLFSMLAIIREGNRAENRAIITNYRLS